jgi:hypothetical protein
MKLDRAPIERALDHHAAIGTIQRWTTTPDRHHLVTLIMGGTVTLRTLDESQAFCAGLGTAARAAGITRQRPAETRREPGKAPAAVLVDGHDGFTWAQDETGQPFTIEAARELAGRWNARMKPEHARFRVYALTLADAAHENT